MPQGRKLGAPGRPFGKTRVQFSAFKNGPRMLKLYWTTPKTGPPGGPYFRKMDRGVSITATLTPSSGPTHECPRDIHTPKEDIQNQLRRTRCHRAEISGRWLGAGRPAAGARRPSLGDGNRVLSQYLFVFLPCTAPDFSCRIWDPWRNFPVGCLAPGAPRLAPGARRWATVAEICRITSSCLCLVPGDSDATAYTVAHRGCDT